MALPLTRNTDYAPEGQVLSADLNDIQDKIIDLNAGVRTVEDTIFIPAIAGNYLPPTSSDWLDDGAGGALHAAAGADSFFIPIAVPVGTRIKSVDVYVNGDTSKTVSSRPKYKALGAGVTELGTLQTSALTDTEQTLTHAALNHTVATGRFYFVTISCSAAAPAGSVACYGIKLTVDRP